MVLSRHFITEMYNSAMQLPSFRPSQPIMLYEYFLHTKCYSSVKIQISTPVPLLVERYMQQHTKCVVISTASGAMSSEYSQTNFCRTLVRSSFSVSRINVSKSVTTAVSNSQITYLLT